MANQYVKDLSLDIKRGMRQKAERGWFPVNQLPIGYIHKHGYNLGVDDEIIPNDKQYQILKTLWKLLLSGKYSVADLKKKGDALGLRYKNGNKCSRSTYYYLFTNEFYSGYYYWKDRNGNLVRYKGKHKIMVNPAEFQKAQIIISGKTNCKDRTRIYNFPYRGIISCGECGSMVTPDHKLQVICTNCKLKFACKWRSVCPRCNTDLSAMKNPSMVDVLYYHCTKSKGKCSQGSITRQELEKTLETELKRISIGKGLFHSAMEAIKNYDKNQEEYEAMMKRLENRKSDTESKISRLIDLRADGELNSEQFSQSVSKKQKELSEIECQIDEMERQVVEWFDEKKKDLNFALEVLKKFKNGDDSLKTEIAREFASNLTLLGKKLYITIRKPLLDVQVPILSTPLKNPQSNLKMSL